MERSSKDPEAWWDRMAYPRTGILPLVPLR